MIGSICGESIPHVAVSAVAQNLPATLKLTLREPSVNLQQYYADTLKIFATDEAGKYTLVKTEADVVKKESEKGPGKDLEWWTLSGWDQATTKIRVELFSGKEKNRNNGYYIGISHFKLYLGLDVSKEKASPREILEMAIDLDIPDPRGLMKYAKAAMKEEFTQKMCYE